jgi:hypothetical protein
MSNKTQAELAIAVLRKLNVIDAAETADTEDSDYVIAEYVSKYEELADRELNYWPLDAIPGAIFGAVRDLIINDVAGTFGQVQTAEDQAAREDVILKKLRRHMQKRSSGLPVFTRYF